jgi:hypothetical protein
MVSQILSGIAPQVFVRPPLLAKHLHKRVRLAKFAIEAVEFPQTPPIHTGTAVQSIQRNGPSADLW